jgi:hypothetical protein
VQLMQCPFTDAMAVSSESKFQHALEDPVQTPCCGYARTSQHTSPPIAARLHSTDALVCLLCAVCSKTFCRSCVPVYLQYATNNLPKGAAAGAIGRCECQHVFGQEMRSLLAHQPPNQALNALLSLLSNAAAVHPNVSAAGAGVSTASPSSSVGGFSHGQAHPPAGNMPPHAQLRASMQPPPHSPSPMSGAPMAMPLPMPMGMPPMPPVGLMMGRADYPPMGPPPPHHLPGLAPPPPPLHPPLHPMHSAPTPPMGMGMGMSMGAGGMGGPGTSRMLAGAAPNPFLPAPPPSSPAHMMGGLAQQSPMRTAPAPFMFPSSQQQPQQH